MPQSTRAGRAGDVVAVVSQSGPTVSFFDAVSDRHLGTVETLAEPHELCFDPTHRLLWCANTYRSGYYHANAGRRSELTVIDPTPGGSWRSSTWPPSTALTGFRSTWRAGGCT